MIMFLCSDRYDQMSRVKRRGLKSKMYTWRKNILCLTLIWCQLGNSSLALGVPEIQDLSHPPTLVSDHICLAVRFKIYF